jgi:hypothetical protein
VIFVYRYLKCNLVNPVPCPPLLFSGFSPAEITATNNLAQKLMSEGLTPCMNRHKSKILESAILVDKEDSGRIGRRVHFGEQRKATFISKAPIVADKENVANVATGSTRAGRIRTRVTAGYSPTAPTTRGYQASYAPRDRSVEDASSNGRGLRRDRRSVVCEAPQPTEKAGIQLDDFLTAAGPSVESITGSGDGTNHSGHTNASALTGASLYGYKGGDGAAVKAKACGSVESINSKQTTAVCSPILLSILSITHTLTRSRSRVQKLITVVAVAVVATADAALVQPL